MDRKHTVNNTRNSYPPTSLIPNIRNSPLPDLSSLYKSLPQISLILSIHHTAFSKYTLMLFICLLFYF